MSCAIKLKSHHLGVRSQPVEFAPVDADEGSRINRNVARLHSNRCFGRAMYSRCLSKHGPRDFNRIERALGGTGANT